MADTSTQQSDETAAQPAAAPEGGETGGFDEAFAERAEPKSETSETKAAEPSAATTEAPAPPAGSSEAPSKEAAAANSGTGKPDPWEGLTPEQRDRIAKLEQSERSNRGRVGALTKQLNQFNGTRQPPRTEEQPNRERSDTGAADTGKDSKATDIEARLKATTEEYGDIVGPVAELVQELRSEIAGLKASATRHEVEADTQALTRAYAELESKHSDYREIPSRPEFQEWYGQQPQGVQALLNSFDPKEVSLGLQLFKTETGAAQSPADATTAGGQGGNGGTATGDRRERQKEALKAPADRGAPAAQGVPNDFDSAFEARANQKRT